MRFTHPFPADVTLNQFGDYKALVLQATRENDDPGSAVTKTWTLVGDVKLPERNQPIARVLTPEQLRVALEAIFLAGATRE